MTSNERLLRKQKVDAELTKARTELARTRHHREAMAIARQRGELISNELITHQAQYILICLRQAILNFPAKYSRHVLGIADEHQAKAVLTKAAHEFLNELSNFPEKIRDPDWLKEVEADGHADGKPARPSSGVDIKAEQEKAKKRRKKKTETMRKFRAKAKIG